jgi:uncharacterized protein
MKCPIDNATLVITERRGVEIDYCPECRGVWLDRGELDKMIALDDKTHATANFEQHRLDDRQRESNEHYTGHYAQPRKKKESFLSELFDFGD